MWSNPLTYCALAGIAFGIYPAVARYSGLPSTWLGVLVTLGTLIVVSVWTGLNSGSTTFTPRTIGVCLLAGLINGIGMVAFTKLLGWQGSGADISKVVPLASVIMVFMVLIVGIAVFREPLTAKKLLGVAMAAGAIMLLK